MTLQIRILLSCVICLDVNHDNQANNNNHGVNYKKLVKIQLGKSQPSYDLQIKTTLN